MKFKGMKIFWGVTILVLIAVLGVAGYFLQQNFSDVKASVMTAVTSAQKYITPSVLKGAVATLNETESVNLDMEYKKVDIVKYTAKGGNVTFQLVDQKIGSEDSYAAKCVNKDDLKDVVEVKYGIPLVNVYGLLESARYVCTFSVERYGMKAAESRPIFVSTGDTPYDNVSIESVDSYSDSLVLNVKDQYLENGDKYFAECSEKGGEGVAKGASTTAQIKVKGLTAETGYDCVAGVLRGDKKVNLGESFFANTKMKFAKVVPSESKILFAVAPNENRSVDLYIAECKDMESDISQTTLLETPELVVSGLSPETKYQCVVSTKKGTKILNSTETITLKTLESPYGILEILKFVPDAFSIDLEVKAVAGLSASDFYYAECVNKNNSEKVYTAKSKYPQLKVRELEEKTEYDCTVGVQTPKRISGKSEPVAVTTTSLEQSIEQLENSK